MHKRLVNELLLKINQFRFLSAFLLVGFVILLSACNMPMNEVTATPENQIKRPSFTTSPVEEVKTATTTNSVQPATPTPKPSKAPTRSEVEKLTETPTDEPKTPILQNNSGSQLAYLAEGDIWLTDLDTDKIIRITETSDLLSFAWAPDGTRLATFNGNELCQILIDGSQPTCIKLDLDENQSLVPRMIAWSPDLRAITLWNPMNPWDETAIGWIIISLEGTHEPKYIQDPVNWGATLTEDKEPGGVTGQALYLSDNTLVGTMTHYGLCGESGCHYQLFYYDQTEEKFAPFPNKPEEGFSEGMGLHLSTSDDTLYNFGTFHTGCEAFITFIDAFNLDSASRQTFNLPQVALNAFSASPDGSLAVMTHNAGCSTQNKSQWAINCGLAYNFDVFSMKLYKQMEEGSDLPPGLQPAWSSDGESLAFRSCLEINNGKSWKPTPNGPPEIYVMDLNTDTLVAIAPGEMPQWRP